MMGHQNGMMCKFRAFLVCHLEAPNRRGFMVDLLELGIRKYVGN